MDVFFIFFSSFFFFFLKGLAFFRSSSLSPSISLRVCVWVCVAWEDNLFPIRLMSIKLTSAGVYFLACTMNSTTMASYKPGALSPWCNIPIQVPVSRKKFSPDGEKGAFFFFLLPRQQTVWQRMMMIFLCSVVSHEHHQHSDSVSTFRRRWLVFYSFFFSGLGHSVGCFCVVATAYPRWLLLRLLFSLLRARLN